MDGVSVAMQCNGLTCSVSRVAPSSIPGAGQGLFSRGLVAPSTLLAYYHGLRLEGEDWLRELTAFDQAAALEQREYWVRVGTSSTYLPPGLGRHTTLYCASLGHKVNHSFNPNCRSCSTELANHFGIPWKFVETN